MTRRSPLIVGVLAAVALTTFGAIGPATATAYASAPAATAVVGTLQPGFATTTPTTLQILTRSGAISVTVGASTTLVRRYDAPSSLAEFQAGDLLGVTGTMNPDNTLTPTAIKDLTIQAGFTNNVGVVTNFTTNSAGAITQLKVRVLGASRFRTLTTLRAGQIVAINVAPATLAMSITLADGTPSTLGEFLTGTNNNPIGLNIFTLGVYNRNTATFESLYRLRVLSATAGTLTMVNGILQQAPASLSAPTTITLMTRYHGVVTINVDANTLLVRHFNGQSSLGELSAGDSIAVVGIYNGGSTYSAKVVKDLSIQRGYTFTGQITAITSSSVTVLVLANNKLHPRDPIHFGDKVTIPLTANTVVVDASGHTSTLSAVQPGTRVIVVSVYNYKAHNFTAVDRIRIMS